MREGGHVVGRFGDLSTSTAKVVFDGLQVQCEHEARSAHEISGRGTTNVQKY